MEKITINCSCGTAFDVDDIDPGAKATVKCPSCATEVGIEGSDPGEEEEVVEAEGVPEATAAEQLLDKLKQKPVIIGASVGGGALLLIVILIVAFSGGSKPEPVVREKPPKRYTRLVTTPAAPTPPPPSVEPVTTEPDPIPAPPPAPKPRFKALPFGLKRELRKSILELPPFYRDLCVDNEEVDWIEEALKVGMGRDQDVKYLRGLLDRASVRLVNRERERIAASYRNFSKQLEKILPVDRVRFMDGRWVDGVILGKVQEGVRVRRFLEKGPKIEIYPHKDVRYLLHDRGGGSKFLTRWEYALEGTVEDRIKFYEWAYENKFRNYLDLVRWRVLMDDPGYRKFRKELGLPADPIVAAVNAAFARGMILYGQREWPPAELKAHLLREGHLLSQGKWYSPVDKDYVIPGLMAQGLTASREIRLERFGIEVCEDSKRTYRAEGAPQSPQYRQVPEDSIIRRFLAPPLRVESREDSSRSVVTPDSQTMVFTDVPTPPEGTPLQGHALISVDVGEPVVAAKVLMLAEVKAGSWIEVSLMNDGARERAYRIVQRDFEEHLLPASVRGKSRIVLGVAFNTQAAYVKKADHYLVQQFQAVPGTQEVLQRRKMMIHERMIPDYRAILFPSWPGTQEAFRLTATTVRPNKELDGLFARFPSILRR